jgi:PAS domain S-box-containing protein
MESLEILGIGPGGPGTAWYEMRLVSVEGRGEDAAATLITTDITERKRNEEELQAHRHHLEEIVEQRTSRLEDTNQRLRREITMRKKSEVELIRGEERFRSIVEALPIPALISRRSDGRLLYANRHVAATFGVDPDEITTLSTPDFYQDPADRKAVLEAVLQDGHLYDHELPATRADGSPFWAMISIHPMTFEGEEALLTSFHDITARKEAEEALRRQEEYFRALIENSLEGITVVNADGSISYEGPTSQRVLGYKAEDLLGAGGLELVHPDDVAAVSDAFNRVLGTPGETTRVEMRARHADGSWRHIEASGYNLLGHPAVHGVVANFHDITERKEAEEALKESEASLRSLLESIPDYVLTVGDDHRILTSNRDVADVKATEAVGNEVYDYVEPAHHDTVRQALECVFQTGIPERYEVIGIGPEGPNTAWYESRVSPVMVDDRIAAATLISRDITERKKTEEALRRQEEYFRSLIENAQDGVVVIGGDGSIRYETPSARSVSGIPPTERIGKHLFDLVHPDDVQDAAQDFARFVGQEGAVVSREIRVVHADGSWRYVEALGQNLLSHPAVEGIVINFRDITERKEAESKLQELYEQEKELRLQLEEAMNRKVQFTRTLTHELQTPLTSVLVSTDLLLSEAKEEPLLSLVKNINWAASNLNTRVNELLDMAKMDTGMLQLRLETVDVLEVLQEAAVTMAPVAASRGLSLLPEVPPSLPSIEADRDRLRQIIMNMLDNAAKFTSRGGKISLRAMRKDSDIIVEVQDTGRGMTRKEQERIFEPYHRVDKDGSAPGGLGLGLALCKTLVELHGGQMWVASRRGKGSTFAFSLPTQAAAGQAAVPKDTTTECKVLVIEDDLAIVETISLALRMRWPEAQLVSARLGEEGIELVETEAPDIVMLDLGLPDKHGFDVLKEIREFSSVPVVILTVTAEEADVARGLELGADDYVVKPFKQMELLARLRVQLRKQPSSGQGQPIAYGSLRYDPSTSQLKYDGTEINLTTVEAQIVECLMRNAGRVVPHSALAEAVWGDEYSGATHSLRVNIQRLRAKVEADPGNPKVIITKPGIGYMIVKPSYG